MECQVSSQSLSIGAECTYLLFSDFLYPEKIDGVRIVIYALSDELVKLVLILIYLERTIIYVLYDQERVCCLTPPGAAIVA